MLNAIAKQWMLAAEVERHTSSLFQDMRPHACQIPPTRVVSAWCANASPTCEKLLAKLKIVLTKNLVKTGKAAAATRMVGKSHFPEKPGYFYFLWKIPLGYPQPFLQNVGLTGLDRRKRYSHSQLWD
jgi:hypothetical protein